MYTPDGIYMGLSEDGKRIHLPLKMANRHGLIAGASGTGKTITMKVMAESFSDAGVPVFLCDVKGDVSGICQAGAQNEGMEKRIDKFGIRDVFSYKGYPTTFWDVYQENGHPIRATISDMGPELLSSILGLTEAQQGVMNIIFQIADDNGLYLLDMKDLRAMLTYVQENREKFNASYGAIASQSLSAILRSLLPLEKQGGDLFFGEPDLNITDWIRTATDGRGMINLLDCRKLMNSPKLYATFLLWMMSELFERLPEVGDLDEPRLVFFFDEAHLLFSDAPAVLVRKIEQMVKLIRSKGVGIYFVTQSPRDIPDSVLAQLSHRVQHALRAYTPAEQKAIRAAAQSFRVNPAFKTEEAIQELGVGHALTSFLGADGVPGMVEKTAIICPQSLMAPADPVQIQAMRAVDGMTKYDVAVDNDSAYEMLADQKAASEEAAKLEAERQAFEKEKAAFEAQKAKEAEAARKKAEKQAEKEAAQRQKIADRRMAKIETQLISAGGRILKRGLMGTLFK